MRRCQAAASQPNRQAANVAHGALPYIGGARLAPGQLSFATLATAASRRHSTAAAVDDDDVLQVDGFGKGARRRTARARLLLRPEERLLGIACLARA